MYHAGDYVVRNGRGVCHVEDVEYLGARQYYLLVPLEDKTDKIYVPVDLESSLLRDVISPEVAWHTIQSIPEIESMPVADDKTREQAYKEAIRNGEPVALIQVIKRIYQRNRQRVAQGKDVMDMDKRYCKLAEDKLHEELAFALGREKSEMPALIQNTISQR